MLVHLHSKKGHDAMYKLHALRLITMAGSLDPMPDGSTISVVEVLRPNLVAEILAADPNLTVIPKPGAVGKGIASLLSHYNIKETDTKKDVLAAVYAMQPNTYFSPVIEDVT